MLRVATSSGKVGHIVDSVVTGATGRVVTTVCGKTFEERAITVNNNLDACGSCDKSETATVESTPEPEPTPEPVVEETADEEPVEEVEEKPKRSYTKKNN